MEVIVIDDSSDEDVPPPARAPPPAAAGPAAPQPPPMLPSPPPPAKARRARRGAHVYAALRALPKRSPGAKLPAEHVLRAWCGSNDFDYDAAVNYLRGLKKAAAAEEAAAPAEGLKRAAPEADGRPAKLPRTPDAADVSTRLQGRELVRVGSYPPLQLALVREIGKGGFGTAYEAERVAPPEPHPGLPLRLCLKLEPKADKRGAAKGEPLDWAALRKLSGVEGVPRLYETGVHSDAARGRAPHYVTVMALLGESLHAARARRAFSPAEVAAWAVQGLQTLEAAHRRGLLHRDVKPDNLLLGGPDEPTERSPPRLNFCDWGLASTAERSWRPVTPGSLTGTPGYASVHAHLGRAPAPRDDLESFAYALSYALRGRLPWTTPGKQADSAADRRANAETCRAMMRCHASKLFCGAGEAPFVAFATAVFALPFDAWKLPYASLASLFAPIASGPPAAALAAAAPPLAAELSAPTKGRCVAGAGEHLGWILLFQEGPPMKQRYHSHVRRDSVLKHCQAAWADGMWVSSIAAGPDEGAHTLLSFVVDAKPHWGLQRMRPQEQSVHLSHNQPASNCMPADWIAKQWERGYVITAVAGQSSGHSAVVMTRLPGSSTYQQRYRLHDRYPHEWIAEKRGLGFSVTTIAAFGASFLIVVSMLPSRERREQTVEMDFCYPSEPIHMHWNAGLRLRLLAANADLCACVMEEGEELLGEMTERKHGPDFPSHVVKRHWDKNHYLRGITYGRVTA